MQQKLHSRKKKTMSFSFCFPYLASLMTMPVQNYKKQKISGKQKRNFNGKKRPGTSVSRITAPNKQKKISNLEMNQSQRGLSLDFSKRQRKQDYSQLKHKTRDSFQIQRNYKPFAMCQAPSFDCNQIVNRKNEIKKQQKKNKDTDEYQLLLSKNFEIPGVIFKKTQPDLMKQRYSSIPYTANKSSQITCQKILQSSNTRKTNLKWTEQRMLNIQFIINNKCKNFQGTMAQYYQRTLNEKASFIFIFDSKDQWMKRVLINRGWTENKNKHSKAFHLMWTFKYPMNTTIFPQQLINHYRYSLRLTTKIGLYSMLKKYKLSHLQPLTYELDKQKDSFMSTYNKMQFLKDLKIINQMFNSEQDKSQICSQQQLKQKIIHFLQLPFQNPQQEELQRQLKYFLQLCLEIILKTQTFSYKSLVYSEFLNSIKFKQKTQIHIFQVILILKQSFLWIEKSNHISNLQQGGNQNIWIVKSQCSSKGAGMFLSNDSITISKQGNRLAQKYIENVLLLQGFKNRKFDLRIWILVVGGKNFRIYYNQQFYARLCFQPYSLDEKSLKNSEVHLTNYSVNKASYKEVQYVPHSVIFPQQLFIQIQKECKVSYQTIFYEKVDQMLYQLQEIFEKEVCVEANQNTFQLFGVDLLIDYKLDLHLLQINLSAQCEQRHQKLSKMLEIMGQGLLNILQNKKDTNKWRLVR